MQYPSLIWSPVDRADRKFTSLDIKIGVVRCLQRYMSAEQNEVGLFGECSRKFKPEMAANRATLLSGAARGAQPSY